MYRFMDLNGSRFIVRKKMTRPDSEKSESHPDKKVIAEEEREKMLNEENEKHNKGAEAATISPSSVKAEVDPPRRKIPIGGIKMPGFCRPKSREFPKEESTDSPAPGEPEVRLLDAMKRPLVNVLASIKKNRPDGELSASGAAAGLASFDTLGDAPSKKPGDTVATEDGMETVRLDGGSDDFAEEKMCPRKPGRIQIFLATARRNHIVTGAILAVLLLVIIIITIACAGPRRLLVPPLKDGKYMEAVTSCGPVQGILEDGGFAFRGIPYALPPINDMRWKPAQSIDLIEHCWNGTYMAHNSSTSCWQRDGYGQATGDEDCLYLDVFTPQVRYDTPLPVVVMIGADSLSGGSPGVMQPSAKLARVRDMVFVRPNFRLGVFGFLAARPLSRSTRGLTSGNYGISDIIAALNWVQLNIQNFGGDNKAVTIWGHRAGGTLVTSLLAASQSVKMNLFSRAWISSPSVIFPNIELAQSEKLSETFLYALYCNDLPCLMNKTPQDLIKAEPKNWYTTSASELPKTTENMTNQERHEWLVIDGVFIKENIYEVLQRQGSFVKVVMGTTIHSATPSSSKDLNSTIDTSQIEKIIKESVLGSLELSDEALKRYNLTCAGLASLTSEIRVLCPMYNFTNFMPSSNISFYVATEPRFGHLADVDSDVAAILGIYTLRTPEEKRHQSAIQQLFNQFVWHNRIIDAATDMSIYNNDNNNYGNSGRKVIVVGQDLLPQYGYPNCDYWIKNQVVPKYSRVD